MPPASGDMSGRLLFGSAPLPLASGACRACMLSTSSLPASLASPLRPTPFPNRPSPTHCRFVPGPCWSRSNPCSLRHPSPSVSDLVFAMQRRVTCSPAGPQCRSLPTHAGPAHDRCQLGTLRSRTLIVPSRIGEAHRDPSPGRVRFQQIRRYTDMHSYTQNCINTA
jgi:hypothetical protein